VKLIYDFKSKGVKGKYIDAVSLYPTVIYYDRYPVGHPTKTCVDNYAKKTQSIRHILLFSAAKGPQHATKIN